MCELSKEIFVRFLRNYMRSSCENLCKVSMAYEIKEYENVSMIYDLERM